MQNNNDDAFLLNWAADPWAGNMMPTAVWEPLCRNVSARLEIAIEKMATDSDSPELMAIPVPFAAVNAPGVPNFYFVVISVSHGRFFNIRQLRLEIIDNGETRFRVRPILTPNRVSAAYPHMEFNSVHFTSPDELNSIFWNPLAASWRKACRKISLDHAQDVQPTAPQNLGIGVRASNLVQVVLEARSAVGGGADPIMIPSRAQGEFVVLTRTADAPLPTFSVTGIDIYSSNFNAVRQFEQANVVRHLQSTYPGWRFHSHHADLTAAELHALIQVPIREHHLREVRAVLMDVRPRLFMLAKALHARTARSNRGKRGAGLWSVGGDILARIVGMVMDEEWGL